MEGLSTISMTNPLTSKDHTMAQSDMDIFQQYHRGFLGKVIRDITPISHDNLLLKQMTNLQYNNPIYSLSDPNPVFNEQIEVLFSQLTKQDIKTTTFEFHEKILSVALTAFGTMDFMEWLEIQKQSNAASYYHARFLIDTMRFISTGKREMILETWEVVLNSSTPTQEWGDVLEAARELRKEVSNNQGSILNLRDVVIRWCSQHNGIIDLIKTLHVLFGK